MDSETLILLIGGMENGLDNASKRCIQIETHGLYLFGRDKLNNEILHILTILSCFQSNLKHTISYTAAVFFTSYI